MNNLNFWSSNRNYRRNLLNGIIVVITALVTWKLSFILHSFSNDKSSIYKGSRKVLHDPTLIVKHPWITETRAEANKGDLPSRAFPKFRHPFPCLDPGNEFMMIDTPAHEGILFQRPQKTGSTTIVGIILRLAHNRAKKEGNINRCKVRAMHGSALSLDYGQRDRSKSFLFSILRHPTNRAISDFFHFRATAYQVTPTDKNFRQASLKFYDTYLQDLTTRNYTKDSTLTHDDFAKKMGYKSFQEISQGIVKYGSFKIFGTHPRQTIIRDILDDYNFIAVMERMDESLVVFQMLLGLTTKEILYTRARSSGSFSNGWKGRPCFYIIPSFLSPGMKRFFNSEEWAKTIQNDLNLYQAVNRSLDRTIDALGRDEFEVNLQALRRGLAIAEENCKGRIKGMCTEGGEVVPLQNRTCYIWSEGCDHACIDELDT